LEFKSDAAKKAFSQRLPGSVFLLSTNIFSLSYTTGYIRIVKLKVGKNELGNAIGCINFFTAEDCPIFHALLLILQP
jgi:hypothetical protein